LKFTAGRNFN